MANRRTRKIQQKIISIVGMDAIWGRALKQTPRCPDGNYKIWYCWMQGEAALPLIPKLCLDSLRKYAHGHEVVFLDESNYRQYVSIPEHIIQLYQEGRLKRAHFADIMRVELLAQQGGLWMDATLLLTRDLPASVFEFPFFSIKITNQGHFVSRCRWAVFCLGGAQGYYLYQRVAQLFEVYLAQTDVFIDYFLFDQFIDILYQYDDIVRRMIDQLPFSNEKVHQLSSLLNRDFDASVYHSLIENTYLFKLSWKQYAEDVLVGKPRNFYHFIRQNLE